MVAIPQTYLHGVVEVALCDGGNTPDLPAWRTWWRSPCVTVAIPQTYLHGVVEVALCDSGDTPDLPAWRGGGRPV